MRAGIVIEVTGEDRRRLGQIIRDCKTSQKQNGARARAILATAKGCGTAEIMRRWAVATRRLALARALHCVEASTVSGLLRDKTPPPGKAPMRPTWPNHHRPE